MFSDSEPSCSDCKLEMVEKRWNELLVNWINKCVNPPKHINCPTERSLVEIIDKYKNDICSTDIDRAILCTDDLEPFLRYKYPILRLRYFTEEKDLPKKLYIMMSMLLYHCVVSSIGGQVVNDICKLLDADEQEMILKFSENLTMMETTVNNVECSIKEACVSTPLASGKTRDRLRQLSVARIPQGDGLSDSTIVGNTPDGYPDQGQQREKPPDKFKSSVTVMPSSCIQDSTDYSKTSLQPASSEFSDYTMSSKYEDEVEFPNVCNMRNALTELKDLKEQSKGDLTKDKERTIAFNIPRTINESKAPPCKGDCVCKQCDDEVSCGIPGIEMDCDNPNQKKDRPQKCKNKKCKNRSRAGILKYSVFDWGLCCVLSLLTIMSIAAIVGGLIYYYFYWDVREESEKPENFTEFIVDYRFTSSEWSFKCVENRCERVDRRIGGKNLHSTHSRCTLLCMGPQIWPQPIGYTYFSKDLVALATNKLEYKFDSVPSEIVHQFLAETFKLFMGDLARLERIDMGNKNKTSDLPLYKLYIQIAVETDPDPRLRLNTDEAYYLTVNTVLNIDTVKVYLSSPSFCGVRHGLETLYQLIQFDQSTGNLVTVSNSIVKDAPSYKYRGLMIDTGRNYIPVSDLMRNIDAMAACKLNTFHWRISDSASFPLFLPSISNLFEYGAYDRKMAYTKEDIKSIVSRAQVRGIRVLIEVAVPGPVGRAWSWSDDASCPKKNDNFTCDNILCLRLKMKDEVFQILEHIYSEIIALTKVNDVFHLSDSIFSLANCYFLLDDREGFLVKALDRLKLANKGFLPNLPIVWFTGDLLKDFSAKTWERLGVQLQDWNPSVLGQTLSTYRVIHSGKWELSCEIQKQRCIKYRAWQEMYAWKSWRNIDVFSIEGGEAILWTDLVDGGNVDYHLWPRAAAVAERLWSDLVINKTVTEDVFVRLDSQRWRMILRGIKVQPIWPAWCSFNPSVCLSKLKKQF